MGVKKERLDIHMVDWQVTATTIHCDAVDDEVTIIVNKDWSTKCTGISKYTESRDAQLNMVRKSLQIERALECEGEQCVRILEYKQKLRHEEALKMRPTPGPADTSGEIEPSTDEQ